MNKVFSLLSVPDGLELGYETFSSKKEDHDYADWESLGGKVLFH